MGCAAELADVNYGNVQRWTAKSRPLHNADVIVIPVNECNRHWLLMLVSVPRQEIVLLDRCGPPGPRCARMRTPVRPLADARCSVCAASVHEVGACA